MQVVEHCKQAYHIPPTLGAFKCAAECDSAAVVLSHGRHGAGAGWSDTLIIMCVEEAVGFPFLCFASGGGRGPPRGCAHRLDCDVTSTTGWVTFITEINIWLATRACCRARRSKKQYPTKALIL